MRHVLIGAMVLALSTGAATAAEPPLPDPRYAGMVEGDIAVIVAATEAQLRQGEYGQAHSSIGRVMAPEAFAGLSPRMAYAVLSLNARALAGLGDWPAAHQAFVAVTAHGNAIADDWVWRAEAAYEAGDEADALFAASQAAASVEPPPQA